MAAATTGTAVAPSASKRYREIGNEAVWSLSTAKPGNGVEQIRDENVETYWQSDGGQPHLINIQFHRKMSIVEIAFYLDYTLDESYTPKKMSIRLGSTFHDLVEVRTVDLNEPTGWVTIPLTLPSDAGGDTAASAADENKAPAVGLRAFFVQVCVVSMHQNGRDTHVRQAKIYGPRIDITQVNPLIPRPTTTACSQFSVLR